MYVIQILLLLTTFEVAGADNPAPLRYLAEWCDGTRSSGAEITDWSWVDKQPRLNERLLYDEGNRVRWLRDTTLEPSPPLAAVVEFVGGDQLPGKVIAYRDPQTFPDFPTPGHLLIEPTIAWDRPGSKGRPQLRIVPDGVRRIVWERRPHDRYTPATVFCRDGRQIQYRSLRWHAASVRLLLEEGTTQLLFDEIAELHLPPSDPWETLFQQRAILSPAARSLFMTIHTVQGLRATTSLERFEARSVGKESDANNWVHHVQPAWSLDGLYVYHRQIRERCFFAAHEVPLTTIPPLRSMHRSALTAAWKHPRGESGSTGNALLGGGEPYAWGIGVHAHHELDYDLPPMVRTFRTRVALDPSAGGGGCVRAIVYNGSIETEPLYESPLLIGSRKVHDTGRMALAPTIRDRSRLVLVADAVFEGAPAGTDPLDIRDALNWLEPLVELNPDDAYQALTSKWLRVLPALVGWQPSSEFLDRWRLQNIIYSSGFTPAVQVTDRAWSLSRRYRVEGIDPALWVQISHPDRRAKPGTFRVLADGRKLFEGPVPVSIDPTSQAPTIVSLKELTGRDVELTLQFEFEAPGATLDFRGAALVDSSSVRTN